MQPLQSEWMDAARTGNTRLWTYAATLLIIVGALLIWESILALIFVLGGMSDLLLLAVSLLSFAAIPAGLFLGLRLIHRRSFLSLFGPTRRFRWLLFIISGGVWLLLGTLSDLLLSHLQPGNYTWTFDTARFLPYALIALLLLPVQVLGEELLFRAYLTQAVGVKTGSFWLAWIVPGLIFGLLHGANPEVFTYGWVWTLPLYIGLGLLLGWVTLRTAGLEAALGLHLANNLYAALGVTMIGSALPTPALFTIHTYDPRIGLAVFVIGTALYLLVLGLLRRRLLPDSTILADEPARIS